MFVIGSVYFVQNPMKILLQDTYQKMSKKIIDNIHDQLIEIKFNGTISLCGYGEPLLHKDIGYIVSKLSSVSKVEIITNGDVLTSKKLQELYISKLSKILVSMYDGPEQIEKFKRYGQKSKCTRRNGNIKRQMV